MGVTYSVFSIGQWKSHSLLVVDMIIFKISSSYTLFYLVPRYSFAIEPE